MNILVINCGSSSIKYKLVDMPKEEVLRKGVIEKIGQRGSAVKDHNSGLKLILQRIKEEISAVAHRVVHGGEEFKQAALLNNYVIRKIKRCGKLAPLHNPANLAGIEAVLRLLPHTQQVAVFDTAFHQSLPKEAYLYGLPYKYYQKYNVRKYGFHGTSHSFVAGEAARRLKRPLETLKIITCHLGNGCSITAVKYGKSIDTSMGFTPLEGLIMGTRCGDIDPALVTFLMSKEALSILKMNEILNKRSGLKGLSGISNDIREIKREAKKGDKRARIALEVFIYRIRKYIGAYMAIMGGLDAVVFTGGIGENNPDIIRRICAGLFRLFNKKVRILVISTNEELMIAREAYQLLNKRSLKNCYF